MLNAIFWELIGFIIQISLCLLFVIFITKTFKKNKYIYFASWIVIFKQLSGAITLTLKVILTFVLINSPPTHMHTITGKIIYLTKIDSKRLNLSNKVLAYFDQHNIYYLLTLLFILILIFTLYFSIFYANKIKIKHKLFFKPDFDVYLILTLGMPLILNYILHIFNIHIHNKYFEIFIATIIMLLLMPKKIHGAILQIKEKKLGHNTIQVFALFVAYFTSLIIALFNLGFIYDLDCLAFIFLIFALAQIASQIIKINTNETLVKHQNKVFDYSVLDFNTFKEIKIQSLKKGQKYILNKNQIIPVKSCLLSKSTYISPLNINGENSFQHIKSNDIVNSSYVNLQEQTVFMALENFENSSLNELIIKLKKSSYDKTNLHSHGQKFVKIIIYLVALSALLNFLVWMFIIKNTSVAINSTISIILLTCPCGIGTGLPILFNLYVSRMLKQNIYVKNLNVLDLINKIKVIAFDKTGTLTNLHFTLCGDKNFYKYQQIIKSLENLALHPLSFSVVKQINAKLLPVSDFCEHELLGISGKINNITYFIGNQDFVKKYHPNFITSHDLFYVFTSKEILTTFSLVNDIKINAKDMIKNLQTKHHVIIISGDNHKNVLNVAKSLNIKDYFANLNVKSKSNLINKIEKKAAVMYVGDGQNDSMSMTNSTIGVSFSSGSILTSTYSDIILTSDDITNLPNLINFTKYTNLILKSIIYFTLFYNIIFIVLASFNLISMGLAPLGEIVTTIIILIFVFWIYFYKLTNNLNEKKL